MTINEIAKLAGVSAASVSRYLNNGYLSQEKRERIAKVIAETGYTPSSQAQMLRTKKTKLIGVIIPKIDSSSISQVVAGISELLSANGYQMLLANTENNTKKEIDYIRIFSQNMVDGIILLGTELTAMHISLLKELPIPVIILGQYSADFSCIYHDDYAAAKAMTSLFIKKGYRQIAYIGVPENDKAVGYNRKQGFLDALKQVGLSVLDEHLFCGDFTIANGYINAYHLTEKTPRPDAILCATDTIAFGVMKALHEQHYSIPMDYGIAGFGDSAPSSILSPGITTVHFFYRESGVEGAKALLSLIEAKTPARFEKKLSFTLIERESLK
ncbi:transcriptional regulator, LacI family [Lachnospiraceae bacterium XBB1006]|nr:transcriptional regulator, LacI family [Lachnospiraceae bacterium XBB1006]